MDKTESILKIVSLILFIAYLIISCQGSNEANNIKYLKIPHPSYSGQAKIYEICIENNVYYLYKYGTIEGLAPKLNNDGTPVSCQE